MPDQSLPKPIVCVCPGILLIFGSSLDTELHSHHAIQLVLPLKNTLCTLNNNALFQPFIINSQSEHQLIMNAGWIFLIEPETDFGRKLQDLLVNKQVVTLPNIAHIQLCHTAINQDPIESLSPIFSALNLGRINHNSLYSYVADQRIKSLLSELNQCLQSNCKLLEDWHASNVASKLALSESRFLHLFREEMGIAWRPYLLWRRIICAVEAMVSGSNATNAAHLAGFSDSAHLSRTFRSQFGITIRQAQKIFRKS